MKKICGYKSLDGQIYDTEKECKLADIQHDITHKVELLQNLPSVIKDYLRNVRRGHVCMGGDVYRGYKLPGDVTDEEIIDRVLELFALGILRDSDKIIEIIKTKERIGRELELQRKEYDSIKNAPWYLKFKWW